MRTTNEIWSKIDILRHQDEHDSSSEHKISALIWALGADEEEKNSVGTLCQECNRRYKIDLIVPDELWEKIKPSNKPEGAGLLCGSCIMKRLELISGFRSLHIDEY